MKAFGRGSAGRRAAGREAEGGLLGAAQAGRGTDGLGVATVAMWPPVPRREADEGGRGAANPRSALVCGRSGAEAKSLDNAGGHRQVADIYGAAGGRGDAAAKRTAARNERSE